MTFAALIFIAVGMYSMAAHTPPETPGYYSLGGMVCLVIGGCFAAGAFLRRLGEP